ncbi:hypothetical protein M011DRAFT_502772 [Sporormia fimetaria CBS 119925]|uniref:Uncharacterized protein n=1 Tax=Sporormia fimetaria CBS 119925 TaxID=1340428 RepID=A0A6A6V692_9PLEO|nr:hypothetical protein M011DRAFT_502772 [Sporormia fimetaria CBS 119925]
MGKRQQKLEQKKALKKLAEQSRDGGIVIPPSSTHQKGDIEPIEATASKPNVEGSDAYPKGCRLLADPNEPTLCDESAEPGCRTCNAVRQMLANKGGKETVIQRTEQESEDRQLALKAELESLRSEDQDMQDWEAALDKDIEERRELRNMYKKEEVKVKREAGNLWMPSVFSQD